MQAGNKVPEGVEGAYAALREAARRVARAEEECRMAVDVDGYVDSFRPGELGRWGSGGACMAGDVGGGCGRWGAGGKTVPPSPLLPPPPPPHTDLMELVLAWSNGAPFAQIMKMTKMFEVCVCGGGGGGGGVKGVCVGRAD